MKASKNGGVARSDFELGDNRMEAENFWNLTLAMLPVKVLLKGYYSTTLAMRFDAFLQ